MSTSSSASQDSIRYYREENIRAHSLYDDNHKELEEIITKISDLNTEWKGRVINPVVGLGDKLTERFQKDVEQCVGFDDSRQKAKDLVEKMGGIVQHSANVEPLTPKQIVLLKGHYIKVDDLLSKIQKENIDQVIELTKKLETLKDLSSRLDKAFKELRSSMEPFASYIKGGDFSVPAVGSIISLFKATTGRVGYMREAIDEARKKLKPEEKKD